MSITSYNYHACIGLIIISYPLLCVKVIDLNASPYLNHTVRYSPHSRGWLIPDLRAIDKAKEH